MLTLIGREVRDHIIYLAGLWIVTAMAIGLIILAVCRQGSKWEFLPALILLTSCLLVGFCALGAAQMYGDRANRMAPLLSTLAVTRDRILVARVLVGSLAVLISLVPLALVFTVLLQTLMPPLKFYGRMVAEISATVILTGFACYCAGLLVGWTTNKARLLGGSIALLLLLVSLVWIKGFGLDAMAILVLFIGATLLRVRHTFTSVSL